VAPGTVLPWGSQTERPDYDYADGVVLRVFGLGDGERAPFAVAGLDGRIAARGTVQRTGGTYTATVDEGALRGWSLEADGRRSPVQDGGSSLAWTA
jgi:alpha-D-xyloside xylohydrolase